MMKKYSFILFLFSLIAGGAIAQEAGPGCPNVNIQDITLEGYNTIYNPDLDRYELHLPCGVNQVDLTTTYLPGREGADYEVTSIPYEPPFPFEGGSNAVPLTIDDQWSQTINMGFDFCFFWEPYNKALITDNGALTFDIVSPDTPGGGTYTPGSASGYSFNEQIPNGNVTIPYRNAIFGVMQDLLPSGSFPGYSVTHEIIGESPCRMLVFNINKAGHYSCTTSLGEQTSQIVLYETTNAIDVYVKRRDVCPFNNGSGLIGIQSRENHINFPQLPNGIQAYAPPGRNTGQWTAENEAWRFNPSGEITNTIKWYVDDVLVHDEGGNAQGSSSKNFTFTEVETTIRVEGHYENCYRGGVSTDVTEITVIMNSGFSVDLGDDISTCNAEEVVLSPTLEEEDGTPITNFDDFEFLWQPGGETTREITVTESGTYTLEVTRADCVITSSIDVYIGDGLPINSDIPAYDICEIENGEAVFDLTSWNNELIPNHEAYEYVYYESEPDALADENPIAEADLEAYTSGNITIFVVVTDPSSVSECTDIASFDLVVNPLPELLSDAINLNECDDGSGTAIFDLEDAIALLMNDATGFTFTFHDTAEDAQDSADALPSDDLYTGDDGEEIFIRVESEESCASYATLTLNVVDAPEIDPLDPFAVCEIENGTTDFDLDSLIPGIQAGDTNLEVTFYLTEAEADGGQVANQLSSPYNSSSRIIYVRVVPEGADCAAVLPLELVVDALPVLPASVTMLACEDPDEDNTFDLTDAQLEADIFADIVGDISEYEVYFFEVDNLAQAEAADVADAIDTTVPFETAETIRVWVRVLHDDTACFSSMPLDLVVNPLPVVNAIDPLQVCDVGDANGIAEFDLNLATIGLVGESNYGVTYYLDQASAEANNPDNALNIAYENVIPYNQTIYAVVADNITECSIIVPVELVVEEAPEANTPEPLIYCDPNNDGEGTFFLPDARDNITTDPDAVVSFHRTRADAENDVNPLDDTVNNNELDGEANQIIYVRVGIEGIDCASIVELELIVLPTPVLETPTEVIIGCDIDDNGTPLFNLEEIVLEQVVVNLTNLDDYNIYYYSSEDNRDNDVRIPVPSAYPSAGGTVIVVVEDIATGCSSQVEIELFVAPLPEVVHPVHMEVCDVNNPGDEIEDFYLDEATQEITGGDQSLTVTYHESQADADTGDNPLAIPYENTENNQTIYIRVENEYGCTVTTGITLTLVVNPLPAPVTPEPLEVCDIDNEGYAYFDLDSLENEIIANEPGVHVSFHETFTDAENATNPLTSPYQNIVADEQIVFARVFFADPPNGTGCFTIIEVILRAVPSPVVPVELDDLYFCTPDLDQGVRVNLTVYETVIYGLQNQDELDLTYHLTEDAAHAGTGAIDDPTDFLLNPPTPRTIWVRLGYKDDGCYNVVPFVLHLVEGPQINDPTALSMCTPLGEENTETAVFDLLDKREEIIGNQTGLGLRFYEEEEDALLGNNNHISNPSAYTNIENPQVIYVRVADSQENEDGEGCVTFTTLTLRIEPNPEPVTPDPIEVCHLSGSDEATEVDLTIRDLQILNHEDWELEYYEKYRDAVAGDPFSPYKINAPETYEIFPEESPKTIYVRVINPESGCFAIVELEIILSGLPNMALPEDIESLVVCSTADKDWAEFDLTSKIPEIFGNQNLDGLNIFFYENEEEAIAGENPILDPESYYNTSNPQTIYVGIGNPEIEDCYYGGITWFELEVREGAIAHSPADAYKVCGVDDGSGGIAEFYLANPDLIDEILGLQSPSDFYVDFYENEEDAEEGNLDLALGDYYTNTSNPQTIYVRVTNQESGCYAIAEVVLEVVVLEDLILQDIYSLCTDEFGNLMEDENGAIIYPIIDTGLNPDEFEFTWYYEDEVILTQVGPSLEVHELGTYRVEIVSLTQGCILIKDIEVVESSMPFNYGAEVTSPAFSGTYNVEAWAEGFGDYWFSIDGGAEQDHGSFTNVGIGSHVITITDRNGCGSVDVIVNVVDYPKFFTPNDDGYNDTWNIPGMAELDPSAEIFIFDRHGKLLKQLNPLSEGWDGTFNGKALPSTDYWFVVKYMEDGAPREFKGHFSLKR